LIAFANAYRDFALAHPGRYTATRMPVAPEIVAKSPGHLRMMESTAVRMPEAVVGRPSAAAASDRVANRAPVS
jgi:hypothetical protein